jgi:hypothetical protein
MKDHTPETKVPVWQCDICRHLVDVSNGRIDAIDHLLDVHRDELISGEYKLLVKR